MTTISLTFPPNKHPNSGVYCIRNIFTKKMYVGSSKQLKHRLSNHRSSLRAGTHHAVKLQRAWEKYGEDAFEIFVMEYAPPDELKAREQYWFDVATCEYNSSRIAAHPEHSAEVRAKISEKVRLSHSRPEYRKAASERMKADVAAIQRLVSSIDRKKLGEHNKVVQREKHRVLEAFGRKWCVKELAETYGVNYGMLRDRIRAGWDVERAVTQPKRKGGL